MYEMLKEQLTQYILNHEKNCVTAEDAISERMIGLTLWDAPLLGVADAADPLFCQLRREGVVHAEYPLPTWWLPGAKRVLSFFLPFTARIKRSNGMDAFKASPEWLHGRIEGHEMLNLAGAFLCRCLEQAGYAAVMPSTDSRFSLYHSYASNWSERHVAFICGLGTFCASKGLITAKGIAGRFGSVITDCPDIEITPRTYADIYEYCIQCNACAHRCPVQVIDLSRGLDQAKDHSVCGPYVAASMTAPQGKSQKRRYGCGKCQVRVPCADGIPLKRNRA